MNLAIRTLQRSYSSNFRNVKFSLSVLRIFSVQIKNNPIAIIRSSPEPWNFLPRDFIIKFNSGGPARKSFIQFQDHFSFPRAIHIKRDETRTLLSGGKSKKVFLRVLILSIPESMAPRTRPNIWYMAPTHQVVDPGFLLLTHTLGSIHRRHPLPLTSPFPPSEHPRSLPRHSFPFYSWPPENPRDFLRIYRNHKLRKVAEHVDRAPRCRVC